MCIRDRYITDRLADRDDIEDGLVFISSCQPKPGCMEAVKAGLKKYCLLYTSVSGNAIAQRIKVTLGITG